MDLNVSTQQLACLVAACTHDSLKEAAASLGISQPGISQAIAELEKRLGIKLFERQGRQLQLRPDAQPVYDYARGVLASTEGIGIWLDGFKGSMSGILRVGMIDTAAIYHYARAIEKYQHNMSEVDFSLTVAPSAALLESLQSGTLDVAVMVEPAVSVDSIKTQPLISEEIAVYAPTSAALKPKDWGPWVSFPQGSHTRRTISAALTKLGAPFEVVAESHQPEVLLEMVRQGFGWAALPAAQVENSRNPIKRARKAPLCKRQLVVATHESRDLSPVVLDFVKLIASGATSLS